MAVSISMTVTVPDVIINSDVMRLKIRNALERRTGPEMMRQFKKTVEGWDNPAQFHQRSASRNDYVSVTVFTRQKQYAIVNAGSPPHTITPKRGGMLRFQRGYRAATKPRILSSRAKQRSGPVAVAGRVSHPGFEAREFDEAVAKEVAAKFAEDVQFAISLAGEIF